MPHVLPYHLEIKRPQRPDRTAGHATIARHDGHDAVLDHESGQGRELVDEPTMRAAPFVAVLAAEGVELIGNPSDDAFDRLVAFGGGDGDDGDEVFVLHVGVCEGPFIIFVDGLEERFLGYRTGEELVADAGAGHYEVG